MTDLPPTDRPLTAGDVPLLREGDVLRVESADTFMMRRSVKNGDRVQFLAAEEEPTIGTFISIKELPNAGMSPYRFTFVSRPAASDEGVGDLARLIAAHLPVGACPDTYCIPVTITAGELRALYAALASPPVSERERELEGALRQAREYIERFSDVVDGDYGAPEPNEAMQLVHAIDQAVGDKQ